MDRDRKRDSRERSRRDPVTSASSIADKNSRLRMDSYGEGKRGRPSPPRRKEIDNVMKKARRDTDKSQYWNKKLLEVEEKDPNRWRHSGYKELYGEKSSSVSKSRSRSRSPPPKRAPLKSSGRGRSPLTRPAPMRRKSHSRSRSPNRPNKSSRAPQTGGGRGRPSPPQKAGRGRSPSASSESVSSCSDDSCSVCSPKQTRRKAAARSRSRSFSVPRSRPGPVKNAASGKPSAGPGSKSTATIGRKPPPKPNRPIPRVEGARTARDKPSPPRDPRPTAAAVSKTNDKNTRNMLANVKIEGQKKRVSPESDSDESSSSSDASVAGAPKMTLSERFGKMAQWSVDRRDIDYMKNMKITKESDSSKFKVVIDGPDDEEIYRAAAPDFGDRRVGAGFYPEAMHSAPVGLSSWDDVRVRYKYYKGRGYLRDLSLDDYMKWEEWWYKYQEWLEAQRYYEHWANVESRHSKRRRYGRNKHSPLD